MELVGIVRANGRSEELDKTDYDEEYLWNGHLIFFQNDTATRLSAIYAETGENSIPGEESACPAVSTALS